MSRTDQFDMPIPDDLVVMPTIEYLTDEDIRLIDITDWYDADGILLVSAKAIKYLSEDSFEDTTGRNLSDIDEILHVSPALHRWNYEDGFYHA